MQNICTSGWNYLDNFERDRLNIAIAASTVDISNFISADTWFLYNVGRSIQDVPARVWAGSAGDPNLGSTCAFANVEHCRRIVQDGAFLFENMTRIGVDSGAVGDGLRPSSIPPLVTFVPTNLSDQNYRSSWFLPVNDHSYIGHEIFGVTDPQFACGPISFPFPTHGYYGDGISDVCWVCQDLPTQLYSQLGFNLQNRMRFASGNFNPVNISSNNPTAQEVNYRNVGVVREYLRSGQGILPQNGSQVPYRVGEMVLLLNPHFDSTSFYAPYHVGIVMRGSNAATFEQALDEVLIAQISYSSQGFYTSSQSGSIFAPEGTVGKFEVITLRSYLIKAIRISFDVGANPNTDEKQWLTDQLNLTIHPNNTWVTLANRYLQHLAPHIP